MTKGVYKYAYKNIDLTLTFSREKHCVLVCINDATNPDVTSTSLWDVPEMHYSRTTCIFVASYITGFERRVDSDDFTFVLKVTGNGIWRKGY